jgi:hypothetical protein
VCGACVRARVCAHVRVCPSIHPGSQHSPTLLPSPIPNCRTAGSYAVLAGAGVTSTSTTGAPTTITGNMGTFPVASVTGFPANVLASVVNGVIHAADATAGIAIGDLTIAFNDAFDRSPACATPLPVDIGGQTLYPGLYSAGTLQISGSALTLDAQGDADAVFIFQIATTFDLTVGMHVILAGGAQAKNIFWQAGTKANLAANTIFYGTMMAGTTITSQTGIVVNGRLLARTAAVTMISATVTRPRQE